MCLMSLQGAVAGLGKQAFSSRCRQKYWISFFGSPEKSKTKKMEILAPDGVGVGQNLKPKQLASLDIFLFAKEFNKWWGDRWGERIC